MSYHETRTELDSHADTCVIGKECLVIHETHRFVNVVPYSDTLGGMDNKPIISAALAYDEPMTGEVVILVVHNAILIDEMDNNLLCPMQLRMNDVKVDECPRYLADNPDDNSHSIHFPNDDNFLIPLYLHGVTSYFNTRKPTQAEYQICRQIEMT